MRNLRDFTRLDPNKVAHADLNRRLRNVVYIARSALPSKIRFVSLPGAGLRRLFGSSAASAG